MTRLMLIIAVSTFIGLASARRLGLLGLLVVCCVYLAILLSTRTDLAIGVGGIVMSIAVVQVAYVVGGWLWEPMIRRHSAPGCNGNQDEADI